MPGWNYAGSDFFSDIAVPHADELDALYRDEHVLAYHLHATILLTPTVVVPKRHLASLACLVIEDEPDLRALFAAVQ